jgi:hypothetical protein
MKRSDLPFGSEFSPSQIKIAHVLELADKYGGDWKAFEAAVKDAYFKNYSTSEYNRNKLANNTKLGMIAYGLIDRDVNLTDIGRELFSIRSDEAQLFFKFGQHILLRLNGYLLIQCIQDIQSTGEEVNLNKLREWLEKTGIYFPRGGKHPSIMRLWLEKAKIFKSGWHIDEDRLKDVLGKPSDELDILSSLTAQQRAYLKTLANINEKGPFVSSEIEKLASVTYGIKFDEKNLPKQVLYPLEKVGYIVLERGTKKPGRGAKPFMVRPTDMLRSNLVVPIIKQIEKQTGVEIRHFLKKPLIEIVKEIKEGSKYERGLALEAFAIRLMRLIDLTYKATRLRGNATGGAEVDVIFESDRLVFSRWQVQCKNTKLVVLDDIAKEIGLTHFLKSNVVVIVTTGKVGSEARRYANKVMEDSNLCVVIADGDDVETIIKNPSSFTYILNREARHAMDIKKLEI